jgi:predicted nucleotide-binding protein
MAVVYSEAARQAAERRQYQEILGQKRVGLQSVLARYEVLPPASGADISAGKRPARAFISHGGEKPSLTMIQDFLRALGVEPIVVEMRASEGRELHDNVDSHRKQSDFAVVLWTRDIEDSQGGWLPSGSVEIEVGELRSQFAGRVIYLREEGVKLPAMASTLVYEQFTEDNMGPAYMKIATELHGWGWLAVSPPEASDE